MKKRLIATVLTAVMAISLMACGGGSSSGSSSSDAAAGDAAAEGDAAAADAGSGNAEYTIKIGHSDTTTNLIHVSLENFAAYVNEQSGGKVKVDIYASEQLGSNAEMAEMVEMGSLDAMMMPQGQLATYSEKVNALGLPFLFSDYESVYKVLDSEIGEELVADLATTRWHRAWQMHTSTSRML